MKAAPARDGQRRPGHHLINKPPDSSKRRGSHQTDARVLRISHGAHETSGRRDARLNRAAKGLMNQERRAKNKDRASDPARRRLNKSLTADFHMLLSLLLPWKCQ